MYYGKSDNGYNNEKSYTTRIRNRERINTHWDDRDPDFLIRQKSNISQGTVSTNFTFGRGNNINQPINSYSTIEPLTHKKKQKKKIH